MSDYDKIKELCSGLKALSESFPPPNTVELSVDRAEASFAEARLVSVQPVMSSFATAQRELQKKLISSTSPPKKTKKEDAYV